MSQQNSDYFDWMKESASPQVKQELEQMEKSKQSAFKSTRDVLMESYGFDGETLDRVY